MTVLKAFGDTIFIGMASALSVLLPSFFLARYFWSRGEDPLIKAFFHMGRFLFVMPPLVAIFCFMGFFPGWIGVSAILIVHTYLLLPYCTGRFFQGYKTYIPSSLIKQSYLLRLSPLQQISLVELPFLGKEIFYTGLLVFLMASTAFSTILLLSGRGDISTLTLSIFAEFEQGFQGRDIYFLMGAQGLLSLIIILFLRRRDPIKNYRAGEKEIQGERKNSPSPLVLGLMVLYALPLSLFLPSMDIDNLPTDMIGSIFLTLGIGAFSSLITVGITLGLINYGLTKEEFFLRRLNQGIFFLWSVPKILLVSGIFIMTLYLNGENSKGEMGVLLMATLLLFVLSYMPYAWNEFMGFIHDVERRYKKSIDLLRMTPFQIFYYLIIPQYCPVILKTIATLCCFIMGNLLIYLFVFPDYLSTKPLSILGYEAMIRLDMEKASFYLGVQLLLMFLVVLLPLFFTERKKHVGG